MEELAWSERTFLPETTRLTVTASPDGWEITARLSTVAQTTTATAMASASCTLARRRDACGMTLYASPATTARRKRASRALCATMARHAEWSTAVSPARMVDRATSLAMSAPAPSPTKERTARLRTGVAITPASTELARMPVRINAPFLFCYST